MKFSEKLIEDIIEYHIECCMNCNRSSMAKTSCSTIHLLVSDCSYYVYNFEMHNEGCQCGKWTKNIKEDRIDLIKELKKKAGQDEIKK